MKTAVFIASHICYDNQCVLLDKCLISLENQTVHTDIYVSISFENIKYKNEFITKIQPLHPFIHFEISESQLFQMEHIKLLTDKYSKLYELIFFCDDDDTYTSDRIEKFISIGHYDKYDCLRESDMNEYNDGFTEFWKYAVKPYVLNTFYSRVSDNLFILKHKYADVIFRCYLRLTKMNIGVVRCPCHLYIYNKNNPNSICTRLLYNSTPIRERIKNNGMLALFHGSSYYKDTWKFSGGLHIRVLYKNIPNYKQILNIADYIFQRED